MSSSVTSQNNAEENQEIVTSEDGDVISAESHASRNLVEVDRKRSDIALSTAGNQELIINVEQENCELRKKLKYFENLGNLVTDYKQDNEILLEENQNLRLELEQLRLRLVDSDGDVMTDFDVINDHVDPEEELPMSPYEEIGSSLSLEGDNKQTNEEEDCVDDVADDVFTRQPDDDVKIGYHDVISGKSSTDSVQEFSGEAETTSSSLPNEDSDVNGEVDYDDIQKVAEILVSNAEALTSSHFANNDVTTFEGVATQTSCIETQVQASNSSPAELPMVNMDANFLNTQIRSLEEMVGIGSHDPGNDVTCDSSVTSQFAKLAGVFAVMSKKVVQTHKRAKHSKAYCHALLAENEQTKLRLRQTEAELANLKLENERLSHNNQPTTSDIPQTSTRRKEQPVSSDTGKLKARIRKLEAQRTEIVNVNRLWDTQYKRLKSELEKTRRRSREASTHDVATSSHGNASHAVTDDRRKLENDLVKAKKQIQTLMQEKSTLGRNYATAHAHYQSAKRDLAQLKKEKTRIHSEKQLLEAENVRLNQALEAAYNIHQRNSLSINSAGEVLNNSSAERCNYLSSARVDVLNSEEDPLFRGIPDHVTSSPVFEDFKTQVEVLQQQVKIYREDFETERRDREKTQGEKQILEESLTRAQHEVQALNQQVRTHEHDFRQEKNDKERLQRKLQWYQRRDPHYRTEPDLFVANRNPNDPPAYFTHRFGVDETNQTTNNNNSRTSTNRRRSSRPPHYTGTRNNREWNANVAGLEPLVSYPPGDAAENLPAF